MEKTSEELENFNAELKSTSSSSDASTSSFLGRVSSCRFTLAYMSFLGFCLLYSSRSSLNLSLIDMTHGEKVLVPTVEEEDNQTVCSLGGNFTFTYQDTTGSFNWTSRQQALILGAYSWGYLVAQLPAGVLATRGASKWLFAMGVFIPGVLSLLLPLCAKWGATWVIVNRAFGGLFEAMMTPCINAMSGRWVPKYERSFYFSFIQSGSQLGNIITPPLVGYLCSLEFMGGWPICFYLLGVLSIIWFVAWAALIHETPEQHPRISEAEKMLIAQNTTQFDKAPTVPWLKILTSGPVWALCICHFCINWTNFGLSSCLPQYLSEVLNFDISTNGLLSGLPWLCVFISMQCVSVFTDYLRSHSIISTTAIRKLNESLGTVGPGIFLILAGYAGCDATLAIVYINLAMAFFAFNYSGFMCNHLDIAPVFAGILFAITNTFGMLPALFAPIVVLGMTSSNEHSVELWRRVFYLFAGLGVLGGLAFFALGSGKLQPWATPEEHSTPEERSSVLKVNRSSSSESEQNTQAKVLNT